MRCSTCGAGNPSGARFCNECGTAQAVVCPECGLGNRAASRFCNACGARLDGSPARTPSAPAAPREERRWVTVLFADLSGFTAMAERMDHEDVKALANECAERMSAEVRRFGGTVLNVMGDAVVAVFGAPVAHEDDSERAVRAALAIQACPLPSPRDADDEMPRIHAGVNTGEVMAGLMGPEERRDYTVMGDTVNTAARLMSAAPRGSVLVGEETYRATQRLVRYRDVGPIDVRGKERPVAAWEALEVTPLPLARSLGSAPLLGRDDELTLLVGIWAKVVREGRPHLVTVLGEPGIGKSRLIAELERNALADALVLHGRCLPYGTVLGYWALGMALKEAAGITTDHAPEMARTRLGDMVVGALGADQAAGPDEADEIAGHLALLIGLDSADEAVVASQRALHSSVRRVLEALARRGPICLLLEDIHWADDALLDLIEYVASRSQEAPLLILAQARPELLEKRPTWGRGVRAFTTVSLEPLNQVAAHDLVVALCRERGLADVVAEQISRGAGGNPLFAEELVATIAERGGATGVPSVIKALISARLDTLPDRERRTLQLASVVGKHFWEGALAILDASGDIAENLEALTMKDFLRTQARSRFRGDRELAFKHDLIRDVAYETLPRAERRLLHGRVADWIECAEGERIEEVLDLLAHHALQAEQQERAIDYLNRAASRARRAAAHREEAALLAQAVAIAEQLGQTHQVAELRTRRGRAFLDIGLWAEARPELEAGLLSLGHDQAERRAEALVNLAAACNWLLDTASMEHHATEALALAEQVGRPDLVALAMGWMAYVETAQGNVVAGRNSAQQAIAKARQHGVRPPGHALMMHGLALYWLGRPVEAIESSREAIQVAREVNDTLIRMYTYPHLGVALAGSGRYDEAQRVFDEAHQFGLEHGLGPLLSRSVAMSAGLHLDLFDYAENEARAEEARELARSVSFIPPFVSASIDLLLNFARRGEPGRAEALVDEVAGAVAGAAAWHGWLWSLRLDEARAEIALAREDWDEAIRWADATIEQCRTRGRTKYEVIGLTTRARALRQLGRDHEAIANLRQAIELARPIEDPALFVRTAAELLSIDGTTTLATEAREMVNRIVENLSDDDLRNRFQSAEPVGFIYSATR